MSDEQNEIRQQEMRVGAGEQDSNLNTDLIEFLQKWGSWILFALAAVFAGYAGLDWLDRLERAEVNEAFAAYEEAASGANPSPDALGRIADEFEGVRGVAELARLRSADVLLNAAVSGLRPGAVTNEVGEYEDSELLQDDERDRYLTQADGLYSRVLEETRDNPQKRLIAINAAFGRVAVAESKGDAAAARSALELAKSLCDQRGYAAHRDYAEDRLPEIADGIPQVAMLPTGDSMPELPSPPEIELPEMPIEVLPDEDTAPDTVGGDTPSEDAPEGDAGEQPTGDDAAGEDGPETP